MVGFEQIQDFGMVLLGICALITAISGASAAVVKFWRYAHKDTDQNSQDIDEFREWFKSDKRRIQALEDKQDEADKRSKLQLKALFTLLSHEIDGNHTAQLAAVRDEINEYLISK